MQTIQDLHEKIFSECQNILEILSDCSRAEDLIESADLIQELEKRINLLRTLQNYTEDYSAASNLHLQKTADAPQDLEDEQFESQIHDIVENEFHEALVSSAQDESLEDARNETLETDSHDSSDQYFSEKKATHQQKSEQILVSEQLNEIEEFENEISDDNSGDAAFEVEENIVNTLEGQSSDLHHPMEDDLQTKQFAAQNDEMFTETSNADHLVSSIKEEAQTEEKKYEDRGKILDINKEEQTKETLASEQQFEDLEAYHREKKFRLASIKGLKSVQQIFEEDPLVAPAPAENKDTGSILKTNVPTDYMEAAKQKPEFRLDLNDRMAFTKMLFAGSQSALNDAVTQLNQCRNIDEAKEFLSDLYYARKWEKVDEYAQRLWILVENKFL